VSHTPDLPLTELHASERRGVANGRCDWLRAPQRGLSETSRQGVRTRLDTSPTPIVRALPPFERSNWRPRARGVFPSHPHRVATPVTRGQCFPRIQQTQTFLRSLFCFLTSQPFFLTLPPVPDSERGSVSQLPRTFRIVLSSCLSLACVSSSLDRIRLGPLLQTSQQHARSNYLLAYSSWTTESHWPLDPPTPSTCIPELRLDLDPDSLFDRHSCSRSSSLGYVDGPGSCGGKVLMDALEADLNNRRIFLKGCNFLDSKELGQQTHERLPIHFNTKRHACL
jgi:hypothetical protein